MTRQISIKTKFGWVSACEKKGRIVRIKFRKVKNKDISRNLLTKSPNFFTKLCTKIQTLCKHCKKI